MYTITLCLIVKIDFVKSHLLAKLLNYKDVITQDYTIMKLR